MMNLINMTLDQWQEKLLQFKNENPDAMPGAAFRIDNTNFSVARHYGAFHYKDSRFVVVYFPGGELLGVRDDFYKWAMKSLKGKSK